MLLSACNAASIATKTETMIHCTWVYIESSSTMWSMSSTEIWFIASEVPACDSTWNNIEPCWEYKRNHACGLSCIWASSEHHHHTRSFYTYIHTQSSCTSFTRDLIGFARHLIRFARDLIGFTKDLIGFTKDLNDPLCWPTISYSTNWC